MSAEAESSCVLASAVRPDGLLSVSRRRRRRGDRDGKEIGRRVAQRGLGVAAIDTRPRPAPRATEDGHRRRHRRRLTWIGVVAAVLLRSRRQRRRSPHRTLPSRFTAAAQTLQYITSKLFRVA